MLVVKAMGGLGNQMFQYAFAKKLQWLGYEVVIDASWYELRSRLRVRSRSKDKSQNPNLTESKNTESKLQIFKADSTINSLSLPSLAILDSKNLESNMHTAHVTIRNLELESFHTDIPILRDFDSQKFFSTHDRFYKCKKIINRFLPRFLRAKTYKFEVKDDYDLYHKIKDSKESSLHIPDFSYLWLFSNYGTHYNK